MLLGVALNYQGVAALPTCSSGYYLDLPTQNCLICPAGKSISI